MDKDSYTLTFTTAELLCAATALGIVALPLPVAGPTPLTGEALQAEINKGYASLQKRQLIHSLSPVQWQLDNLLAVLVHWLAAPDYLLQLDSWQHSGEQQAETVYFWQTKAVWLHSTADQHQFTFFKEGDYWLHYALEKIGPVQKPAKDDSFPLPQLNLAAFLPKVQQNPTDVDSIAIWQRAGLSSEMAQQAVAKLAAVTRAVTLTWQNKTSQVTRRALLFFTPTGVWSGEEEDGKTIIWLRSISQDDLTNWLTFANARATT